MAKKDLWIPFFLEGVRFNGIVPTKEDWGEVTDRYKEEGGVEFLKRARAFSALPSKKKRVVPRFGFTSEHKGAPMLGEWAREQNIEL
ncbi:MAG: hypothetical protein UW92_C0003G0032 [Candidatus Jorgensenbacteria bacterium GW2011_GWA2_45_13]|uniref:Uncharacterized protein n=1 Tax=Candidatus Jorgensenbacteria bacterium GW2011_GWA2_45_13 TaxID=1618662 RepID=A0A0G1L8W5_9BACT|nr:MAG: hypothetical protein UW92_C0003G0032 [Candidatus Jorgensenbacteria bacterium GW2011_GWA2_45_13]